MEVFWLVVFVLAGMMVGSFLNVCVDRLPRGESIVFPPSHCGSCQHKLGVKDLIPIFSYLALRGRCRYCHSPIPKRVFWVEVASAALFGYLFWHYSLSAELAIAIFYCSLFIVLLVIDLEHGLILNKIVYPAIGVGLIISLFVAPSRLVFGGGPQPMLAGISLPQLGIAQAAVGGAIGLVLFLLIVLLSRGGMGMGDVKMAALIGVATGYSVFVALLLGILVGGVVAVVLLFTGAKKRKQSIPFGPFLSLGTMVTLLWGSSVIGWYFGLF